MKIKERAIALLLSMVMVLTFMPALAFAEEDSEGADGVPAVEETTDVVEKDAETPAETAELEPDNALATPEKEVIQQDAKKEFDEEAQAEVILSGEGRDLICDYSDGYANLNFPESGDKVVVTYSNNETKTFIYDEDNCEFFNGEESLRYDISFPEKNDTLFGFEVWDDTFDVYLQLDVEVIDPVTSVSFAPANITLYSEDIAEVVDGRKIYYLENRTIFRDADGEERNSVFGEGDSITVTYTDGTAKTYFYKQKYDISYEDGSVETLYDCFINGNDCIFYDWYSYDEVALGGNNTVYVRVLGNELRFNVFVDTPELRAEAARQGVYDPSLPKVKAKKAKASKKAFTAKWKKLKKKQLKSGVTNIEVWACADGAFAAGSTIERVVGKKKASTKFRGMPKGTYFVKARAVKYVGGVKYVGPWSAVKRVKVKK